MSDVDQKLPIRFGQFFLYDRIGMGGMAEIFLAKRFAGLGAELQAAIKRILPSFITDDSFGDMLISEAKLCARLSHANIVYTYDLGKVDGLYYIAMEYVEGLDLNKLLGLLARSKQALPLQFALYIVMEALRGLDYAHRLSDEEGSSLGIIHRDVSPTNILISTEGEIKICDFGIAKVALGDEAAENIDEYHLKGKIAYMSPEYLNGEHVDHTADIYAAGILLWELLSGRRMFKSKDEDETLRRAKIADVPPLVDRGFPEFDMLNSLVMKALQKDPNSRFQTGREFIDAIEDYVHASDYMVSQLKFSNFLMENFGESLLAQRAERERSLQELEDYKKKLEKNGTRGSEPTKKIKMEAEALLATFSEAPDSEFEDDEPEMDELEPETPKEIDLAEVLDDAIPVDFDPVGDSEKDIPAARKKDSKPPKKDSKLHKKAKEMDPPSRPSASLWQPDLAPRNVHSSAWIAAGMAAALAAAAMVFYFYFS